MANPVVVSRRQADGPARMLCHLIWCPGCDDVHGPRSAIGGFESKGPIWEWNGFSDTRFTISPSLKVTYGNWMGRGDAICHSFIRGGVWEFLADSNRHGLRGLVPMVPVPDWLIRE